MRTRPGWSGSLPATGWSSRSPKWRANATCSARVMSWSRKNSTRCLSSSARISATSPASRDATPRLTLESSAPIVHVIGSTLIEPRFETTAGASRTVAVVMLFPWVSVSSNHEDRRACRLARFEIAMRLHRILQPVALIDLDFDSPGSYMSEKLTAELCLLCRIGDVIGERRTRYVHRSLQRELHR